MGRRTKGAAGANFVERAIAHCNGSPSELARRISEYAGEPVTRQRVHGWRLRGIFPRDMMPHVERLVGIPLEQLAVARPKQRDHGNVVNRAIRLLGEGSTAQKLADELSKISGRRVTRQMVNGWQATEQFPTEMAPWVHILTHIPVRDLVMSRKKS